MTDYYKQFHPEFRNRFRSFVEAANAAGLPITPGSGFRTIEQQTKLYENRANNKYPVARPGHSGHNHGLAGDFRPGRDFTQEDWDKIRQHAVSNGLTWGGDFNDPIHVQYGPSNYGLLVNAPKGPDGFAILPQDWVKGTPPAQPGPSYSGILGQGDNSPREIMGVGPGQGPAPAKSTGTGKTAGEVAGLFATKLLDKAQESLKAQEAAEAQQRNQVLAQHQANASTKPMMDFQPIEMDAGLLANPLGGAHAIGTSGFQRRQNKMGLL